MYLPCTLLLCQAAAAWLPPGTAVVGNHRPALRTSDTLPAAHGFLYQPCCPATPAPR